VGKCTGRYVKNQNATLSPSLRRTHQNKTNLKRRMFTKWIEEYPVAAFIAPTIYQKRKSSGAA